MTRERLAFLVEQSNGQLATYSFSSNSLRFQNSFGSLSEYLEIRSEEHLRFVCIDNNCFLLKLSAALFRDIFS